VTKQSGSNSDFLEDLSDKIPNKFQCFKNLESYVVVISVWWWSACTLHLACTFCWIKMLLFVVQWFLTLFALCDDVSCLGNNHAESPARSAQV
jgi:hypothetical protein